MAKDFTDITFVLDRSGSMDSIKSDVIGGFNQFIQQQQEVGENASFTLVQFDSNSIDNICTAIPIRSSKPLTDETFIPRGGTPLRDAVGQTIIKTGERLEALPEAERPDKVVFCIYTDGLENASEPELGFSPEKIQEMIAHQHDVYKWEFVYLGANQDAFAAARSIGIGASNAANFTKNRSKGAMHVASANIAAYRISGRSADLSFKQSQRDSLDDLEKLGKKTKN